MEAACARALHLGAPRYRTVQNLLTSGLDQVPLAEPVATPVLPVHANLRGADYYAERQSAAGAATAQSGEIAREGL